MLLRLFGRSWYAHLVMAIILQEACLGPKQLLHLGPSRLALMLTAATVLCQKLVQAVTLTVTLFLILILILQVQILKARVLQVVLHFHAPFGDLVENPSVVRVRGGVEILNKLVRRRLALRYLLRLLDLLVFDHVSHEVLHNVALALLQLRFLHEFQDAQVVDHVFNVFFDVELLSCFLELLVTDPLSLVEWPLLNH